MSLRLQSNYRFKEIKMDTDRIVSQIKGKITIDQLFNHYQVRKAKGKDNWHCFLHDDKSASLIAKSGQHSWKCLTGCDSGDIFTFIQLKEDIDFIGSVKFLAEFTGLEFDNTKLEKIDNSLKDKHFKYLQKRGIDKDTALSFRLQAKGDFLSFPQNRKGIVDGYKHLSIDGKKRMFFDRDGDSKSKLFPDYKLKPKVEYLIFVAGEYDVMMLTQEIKKHSSEPAKYSVKSSSTGEGSFPPDIIDRLQKNTCDLKQIRIIYDNDEAGIKGAKKLAIALEPLEIPTQIVYLDSDVKGYDVSDFFNDGSSLQTLANQPHKLHKPEIRHEKVVASVNIPKVSETNERMLLNWLLNNNDYIEEMKDCIDTSDFFNLRYREVYEFIIKYYAMLGKVNHDMLDHYLTELPQMSSELSIGSSDGYSIDSYVEFEYCMYRQQDIAFMNNAGSFANKILRTVNQNQDINKDELFNVIVSGTDGLLANKKDKKSVDLKKAKEDYINQDEDGDIEMLPTQFPTLNHRMNGGISLGKMTIVAARPSLGKTSIIVQILEYWSKQGIKSKMYSLETKPSEIVHQVFAREHKVNNRVFKNRKMDTSILKTHDTDENFIITNKIRCPEDIVNDIKREAKNGVKAFVIDHLQLMNKSKSKEKGTFEFLSHWSNYFQDLATELNVAIIPLSQLKRTLEGQDDARPTLGDLKGTGSFEEDAYAITMLYSTQKKHQQSSPFINLFLAKCKGGHVGEIEMFFERDRSTYHERFDVPEMDILDYCKRMDEKL